MATDLVCPKCQGHMRAYERSGVTVDQCGDCRGIFLDRGELEHLVDAEQGWQRSHSAPAPSDRYERDRDRYDDDDSPALQPEHPEEAQEELLRRLV